MTERDNMACGDTIGLLLALLEAPEPAIAGPCDVHADGILNLRAVGVLVPDGHNRAIASPTRDDGSPVSLTWDSDMKTVGYFDPALGWIEVTPDSVVRYRVEVARLLPLLFADCRAPGSDAVSEIVPGFVWDVGKLRLPGRERFTSAWFGRRLFDPDVWRQVRTTAGTRPPESTRIILTSTPPDRWVDAAVSRHVLISLTDALAGQRELRIDPRFLAARLAGNGSVVAAPELEVIGDGHSVWLRGQEFRFPRGVRQRQVILFLYERYLCGELRVSVAKMLAELDWDPKTRLRDVFKGHPAWGVLLNETGGMCGLCLDQANHPA